MSVEWLAVYHPDTGIIDKVVYSDDGSYVAPPGMVTKPAEEDTLPETHRVDVETGEFVLRENPDPLPELLGWRRTARCYKRAFNLVLSQRPVSDVPVLALSWPEAPNLLVAVDSYVATLDPYHDLRRIRADVIEYERAHSDLATVQAYFGVSDEWVDDLFRDAEAIQ